MRLSSLISLTGFVMLIAATFCPLFHPLLLTWNMYKANMPFSLIVLLIGTIGIIGIVLMQPKISRQAAWISLLLVLLFYVLSLLKIHFRLKIIPFHAFERFLEHQVKLKWGWCLLIAGPILAILGTIYERPRYKKPVPIR